MTASATLTVALRHPVSVAGALVSHVSFSQPTANEFAQLDSLVAAEPDGAQTKLSLDHLFKIAEITGDAPAGWTDEIHPTDVLSVVDAMKAFALG